MDIVDDVTVQWFIAGSCIFGVITALSIYVCMARRYKKNFWHHGVRLPSQPEKTFWYLVTMSIGCRPFGGHEGDVYMRLIGSRGESNTFLFNAEIHSRLHEAGCQMYLYASAWPLGEINYIIVACGAAERKKRWFLSSVHVKHLSEDKSKENVWYFPYHEWIEVFLDPVKVTLCVVDPEHDLNRRLLLGWLARGVSDFHLWLSMFGPLKYTRFRRSERWACVGSHFVTSIVSCILFNWFISDMGAFVLGVYASAGAAVPIYLCEWLLRQTERHPKIVIEDLLWYKGSGKCNYTPIAYNQYMLPASNDCDISTIACPKCEEDDEQRLQDFEDYHGILRNDRVFWKWLTKGSGITLTPSTTLVSTLSNMDSFFTGSDASRYLEPQGPIEEDKVSQFVETQAIKEDESRSQWSQRSQRSQSSQRSQNSQFYDTPGVQDDDEVSEYFDIEDVESQKEKKKRKPLFSKKIANKFFGKMKGAARFVKNKAENLVKGGNDLVKRTLLRGRDDEDLDREGALASDAEDEISYNSQLQESLHESIIEATNLDEINILEGEMLDFPEDWLNYIKLGPPFVVDPTTVWNVDSQYSISSLGMDGMNFGNFVLLESMPVADFDLLRHGKRPLLHPGGDTNFDDIFRHRTLVGKVSEIKLPPNAENLSLEEGQLISMVYFDLITNGKQWVKPGYPDQAYITPDGDSYVRPATDWMKLDISSKKDFEDWNTIDFRGRKDEDVELRSRLQNLRQKYPEPIPRMRVFSMLMFEEYCRKLADAYDEMTSQPEMHSCMAEMFAIFSESLDGPILFTESVLEVAKSDAGRKAVRNVLSQGRRSTAWTSIICDVTQRLRFQGDNVNRIKDKYGLEMKCRGVKEFRCFEPDCDETKKGKENKEKKRGTEEENKEKEGKCETLDKSNDCVYYEMDRVIWWKSKLDELQIPAKDCPYSELPEACLKKLSRFYRHMLMCEDGCTLFGELLLQITQRTEGCNSIGRLIRFVTSQEDGLKCLIELHRQVGNSGAVGRRILLRMYNAVKGNLPNGPKVLKQLADFLAEVKYGKMLIQDLQVDGRKAHVVARKVITEMRRGFEPFLKSSTRNICHVILRMNELAQCMLKVGEHARAVLDGRGDMSFVGTTSVKPSPSILDLQDQDSKTKDSKGQDAFWKSTRDCCRNYKDLVEEINAQKSPPPTSPKITSSFQWSVGSSDLSCEVPKTPLSRSDRLVSELWEPVNERERVDIYKTSKDEDKPPTPPCEGVIPPCCIKRNYCAAQIRSNFNEFYLQTKDYENFYLNFDYRPSGFRKRAEEIQLSLGGAHGVEVARSESSLPWEATRAARRRQPYLGFHNKHTDLPTVAKKWGRKVLFEDGEQRSDDEDEEKKSRHPCVCVHDDSSGFGCLICSIARQLSVASDSEEVVDIVTDKCQDVPRISTTKLPPFPDYRDVDVVPQKLVEVERQAYTPRTFQDPTKEKEERIEGKKQDQISPAFSHPKIAKLKSKVDQTLEKDAQLDPSNNSSSRAMSIVSPKTGSLDMDIIKLEEDKSEEKEEKTHLTSSDSKIFQTNLKERKEEISESEVSKSQQNKSRLTSSEESNSQKLRKLSSKTGSLVMETSSQEDASAKYKEDPQASLTSNDPKISKFKLEVSQLLEKNSKVNLSKNLFLKGLPKLGTPDLDTSSQKSEVEQTSRTTVHSAFTKSKETISATSTHLENSKQSSIESFEKAEVKRASHTAVKHAGNESTEASEQSEHGSDAAMPFPSAACCRAPTKKRCTCVDQRKKPGDLDLTERNIAMYTRHAGDCSSKDPVPEKPRKVCACIDNAKLKKRPPRPWPITAKNFTQAEETKLKKKHEKECAVNPISDTVAKALQLSQKNSTLEAEPVAFDPNNFTSPEVPSKNAGVSYWAKDRDSVSEFSRPDLDDCSSNGEYCLVCNGRITLVEQKPKPFAYRYLVKHEADERYEEKTSDTTLWSRETPSEKSSTGTVDDARGCCKVPGCTNKVPRGTHHRNLAEMERREREERYWNNKRKMQNEIENRYQQWHPPGRQLFDYLFHNDSNDVDEVPVKESMNTIESFHTAYSQDGSESSESNSIDSLDKLVRKNCKKPVTTRKDKLAKLREFLDETCDLHKLPRFACCRLHDWKWGKFKLNNSRDLKRVYGEVPLSCLCNSVESLSGDFHTAASTMTRAHSVCSECRIRIGTQQTPPCTSYLLPLKAVRCYEDALWRYEKNPSVATDSGISLNTAVDVVDESDVNSMHPTQQHTLMGLMGLSKAQGSKLRRLPAKTASSFISVGSSTPSSGVCCHVQKSRYLPVLHLQGFGCDPVVDYNLDKNIQPIPLDWWRRHDVAIRSTQFCVDECVRLCVLIAQTKNDAITEHQRTCKVCGSDGSSGLLKILFEDVAGRHGGIVLGPRYSEMLPIVWRPTVREHGLKQEDGKENEEKNRLRFYRQLIEAAVESTRALLLTPDLRPLSSKRNQGNKSLDGDDDGETSYDEAEKTSGHVTRLAHFRGMVKALNELIDEISKLSGAKIINSSDIADAVRLQISDVEIEKLSVIKEEIAPESKVPKACCRLKGEKSTSSSSPTIKPILTIVESVIQFIKNKMCGAVEDCRNVLHSPWEIPVKEQHVTGKFIAHIMAKLNFKEPSDKEEYSEVMLDDAIEAAIEAFLNDAVFKATTQTCIQRAVKIATDTKQQLAYLDAITRLCAAKIVRYSEVVDAAVKNTRKVVRGCLGAVEEKRRETEFKEDWWKATEKDNENSFAREHISNLIHTGRDDRGSSLDDVLIGFERLRRHIRYDLILANEEVRLIEDMMDEEAMRLYEGTGTKPERHRAASYDAWTESEVALKEKESPDNVTGDRSDAADNDVLKHYLSSRSCSVTDESANVGEDDVSKNQSREVVLGQSSPAQKAGDRSPGHSSELDDMFGGLSQSKKARKKRHFFVKKKDDSNSGSEESLKEELFVDRVTWIPVSKVMDRIEKHGIPAGINNVDKDQQIAHHTDKLGISNEIQNMSKVLQEPTTDNKKTDEKKQSESFESPISTVHDNTVRSSASVCSATFIGPNPSGGCEEFSSLCDKNSINVNSDSDALSYVTCPSKPGSFSIYEDVLQESISDQTESTTESEKLLPVIKKDSTSISPSSSNTSFSATSQISSSSCGNVKKSPPPLRLVRFSESMPSCLAIAPSAGTVAKPRNVVTRKRPVGKSRKKRAPRQKFGSVFNKVLDQVTDQEGLTRTALQTFKGKNMLHEIFAKSLTPQQMMDYFHGNIRSLIDMQQTGPTLPHWVSAAAQVLLLMMSLGAVTYSCFAAFFYGITDYMLLWAIPIAIFTFGLILEPLKCLGVAWICFLLGWKPVFTNSPLYIKSNPILMKRISSLRPDNTGYINKKPFEFYEHGEPSAPKYEEGLYRRYCANRSRLDCERGQRRKLPSLAESDISLDLDRWQSYGEVDEAEANFISSPLALSEMGDELGSNEAISGFRRGGMDFGVGDASGGFRRGGLDIGGSRKNKEQYPHPMEEPGRTRIVWCRMATSEDGRPPIAIDARRKSINEKSAESL